MESDYWTKINNLRYLKQLYELQEREFWKMMYNKIKEDYARLYQTSNQKGTDVREGNE